MASNDREHPHADPSASTAGQAGGASGPDRARSVSAAADAAGSATPGRDQHGHGHDGGDEHGRDHAHHGHGHAPRDFGRAFAIGVTLNIGFVVVEAIYGVLANSMALLADAGHNLSDVIGLLMAWAAAAMARRAPSARYTYGLRSSSILAALANAVLLLIAVGAIVWQAVWRLAHPAPVAETSMIVVAGIGVVINLATAMMFMSGGKSDINIRGAFLHMAADAAVSLGVVAAGIAIATTGAQWIDPVVSLVIAAVIVGGTWWLLRDSVGMALDAVPPGIDPLAVRACLSGLPGVTAIHDLHIWPLSTTETALTCHLVMPAGHPGDAFLVTAARTLENDHGIVHATLQIEIGDHPCHLAPDHVL